MGVIALREALDAQVAEDPRDVGTLAARKRAAARGFRCNLHRACERVPRLECHFTEFDAPRVGAANHEVQAAEGVELHGVGFKQRELLPHKLRHLFHRRFRVRRHHSRCGLARHHCHASRHCFLARHFAALFEFV